MVDQTAPINLISLKEAAARLSVSDRWLRDHWRELGGTRAFGAIKFFEDLVNARLQAERQKAALHSLGVKK